MNSEDPYRRKTDHTRRRIERTRVEEFQNGTGLPPRSELHRKRRKTSKTKISFPLIRLLVVFFILLPVTIFSVYTYRDVIFPAQKKPVITENGGYETISIDNSEAENKDSKIPPEEENPTAVNEQEKEETETENSRDASVYETKDVPAVVEPSEAITNPAPASEVTSAVESASQPAPANPSGGNKTVEIRQHTVQSGETLYRIAMKYYHSKSGIEIIKEANKLRNNEIYVGQVLKIPIGK